MREQDTSIAQPNKAKAPPTPLTAPATQPPTRWWRGEITTEQVFLALLVLVIWIALGRTQIKPNDFWWHLRTGQIIAETGTIPTTDLFTYTRQGAAWVNQAWMTQLLFYGLYQVGGPAAVILLHMLLISSGYLFVLRACRLQTRSLVSVVGAMLGVLLMSIPGWTLRPQSISYLFFGMTVWILEEQRHGKRKPLWLLPPLFAIWANSHGGFVFGLGLVGLYALSRGVTDIIKARALRLSRESQALLLAAILATAALSLNPQGPLGLVHYVVGFGRSEATMVYNKEFLPLEIRELGGRLFFGATLFFVAIAYARQRRLAWDRLLVLVVFGLASLYTRRVLFWYALAGAPVFTSILARERTLRLKRLPPQLGRIVLAIFLAIIVLGLPWVRPYIALMDETTRALVDGTETPVDGTELVCQLAQTEEVRVFSDIAYAVYQTWACPQLPVLMDTRFELYPTDMWDDYLRIVATQHGWQERLTDYGVNTLLLNKERQKELVEAATDGPEWQVIYEDDYAMVLRRVLAAEKPGLEGE